MSDVNQQVPLIVQFNNELISLKAQRDNAKVIFEQANGAIFACEQFIKMYEDHAKQGAAKFVKDAANFLKPVENQGAINNGKINNEAEKPIAKKQVWDAE